MNTTIDVGDVVSTEERTCILMEVIGAPGIPQKTSEQIIVKQGDGSGGIRNLEIAEIKRHWKPATTRRARGPLKQPRQRDALVVTKVEFRYVAFHKKTKVFADLTISDQLVLAGFEIKEQATGIDVKFPEGVRLVIPSGKLLLAWQNKIVNKFIRAKGSDHEERNQPREEAGQHP